MTLDEELQLEYQKTADANARIKEIRKLIVLEKIKIGAAYGQKNNGTSIIFIPLWVDVSDASYAKIVCRKIEIDFVSDCKIRREWISAELFYGFKLIQEDGARLALTIIGDLFKHENT